MPAASRPSKSRRPSGTRRGRRPRLPRSTRLAAASRSTSPFHSLPKRGRHVQVGVTLQEERGQVAIPVDNLVTGEWEVVGSKGNPHPNYDESAARRARKAEPGAARHAPDRARGRDGHAAADDAIETVGFEAIARFA